jgi:serine/threonine protein kinase
MPRPVPTTASITLVVPGYDVESVLGRGGMGVVYKARDKALGRFVALKIIAGGSIADPLLRQRFDVEARAVARLQHPNIIQIYEIDEHEGCPFLVLEFAEGGSLAQQIVDNPQPPLATAALVETIARAIHSLNRRRHPQDRRLRPSQTRG